LARGLDQTFSVNGKIWVCPTENINRNIEIYLDNHLTESCCENILEKDKNVGNYKSKQKHDRHEAVAGT
jgi:hypothetical protein